MNVPSLVTPLSPDYVVFTAPDFDPNEYANAVLAGEPYPQHGGKQKPAATKPPAYESAKEDISVAISKLNFGIEDVSKQIKNVVTTHHEDLLEQAAGAIDLSTSLPAVKQGLNDVENVLEKLRLKIRVPYLALQTQVTRLQRLHQASDVLRRTSRFVILARRLETQMADLGWESVAEPMATPTESLSLVRAAADDADDDKERTIAKAALSIAELAELLDGPADPGQSRNATGQDEVVPQTLSLPLRSIDAIARHVSFIEDARARVTTAMESMVLTGLSTLDQSLLASSLQTAHNLGLLPELVQSLVQDLSSAVDERIRTGFDLGQISKEILAKEAQQTQSSQVYKSRIRTEPTNATAPQWTASLWARLESLVEEMSGCCVKVYTLEKVLKLKRDAVTQTVFLDEAMKLLESKPSTTFWTALARSLEKHAKDSSRNSMFLQQTLSTGYPRLLRLFQEFFVKIAVNTDTVYTQAYQSPETVLVLRSLNAFESVYLARSTTRLNEAIAQVTRLQSAAGLNEGVTIARLIVNELDSARFDPLLVRSVAKGAATSLDGLLGRIDGMVARDRLAVSLVGPTATQQQTLNGQLATCLHQCWSRLAKLEGEYPNTTYTILKPSVIKLHQVYESIIDPLRAAIQRELTTIIARLHRVDFGKSVDAMGGMGGGASLYMKDLVDKLGFIKSEVLTKFNIDDDRKSWVMSIVKSVIRTFVLHVSIANPLGESGKLQLTSDMTELEFALSVFLVDNPQSKKGGNLESVGDGYRALRAMRPLLFLDNAQLASPSYTQGLPPLIVLHHILVRSTVPLPHSLHGWQESEYVRWVEEHSEEEALTLVEGGLSHWETIAEAEGKDPKSRNAAEYVDLARAVLANVKRC